MHNIHSRAKLVFALFALCPLLVFGAVPPPTFVRSVLTTNLFPFGGSGQALFRIAVPPYLAWSNVVGVGSVWDAIDTNALTAKLDSNVWWMAWGSLGTNALTGKLDSNAWWAAWGSLGTNSLTVKLDSNVWHTSQLALSNFAQSVANTAMQTATNFTLSKIPTIVTNDPIWIDAGAMAPISSTASNNAATITYYTNASGDRFDRLAFTSTETNAATFRFSLGKGFAGQLQANLHFISTNTLNGASNSTWQVDVRPLATNDLSGLYIYSTNIVTRFWSSNTLQICTMPVITVTNYAAAHQLNIRISRLGSATSASGALYLEGCDLYFTKTNNMGGFRE